MEEHSTFHSQRGTAVVGAAPRVMLSFSETAPFEHFCMRVSEANIPFNYAGHLKLGVYRHDFNQFPTTLMELVRGYQLQGLLKVTDYIPQGKRRILTREETKAAMRKPLRDW